jgi:hypothetical protein
MIYPSPACKLNRVAVVLLFALLTMVAVPGLRAQTTASLSGRVLDSSSAVIPGAKVTITNQTTNDTADTVSTKDGTYSFPVLLPGTYTLVIEAKGFQSSRSTGLTVYAGSRATVPDSILSLGSTSDTVTVVDTEQILLTDNASLGATLDTKDISQLALVSRNVDDLVRVLPGVTIHPTVLGTASRTATCSPT